MNTIAARNVLRRTVGRFLTSSMARPKETLDPVQENSLRETCFLVDKNDKVIGTASKRECHRVKPDGTIPLHRAFSVFLFNKKGHLLLQKRADTKITYPNHYTNTCCSHPIFDVPGEEEELNANGVIRAARRRLNYELGIDLSEIPPNSFDYITRMYYMDGGNGVWGEHELDYILFLQKDVQINPNPNEISEIVYIDRKDIKEFVSNLQSPITPWFHLILKHQLLPWWDNLDNLNEFRDHENILKFDKDDSKRLSVKAEN